MAWLLIILYTLAVSPVGIGFIFRWENGTARAAAGIMIFGIRASVRAQVKRDGEGKARLILLAGGRVIPVRREKGKRTGFEKIVRALFAKKGGTGLKRVLRRRTLEAKVQLGGENAAALALVAGFLRAVNGMAPGVMIRCRPVFGGETNVCVRCIAQARLGILLAAFLRALARRGKERKEEKEWIIPSGA